MKTQFKEVAHLYLGCKCAYADANMKLWDIPLGQRTGFTHPNGGKPCVREMSLQVLSQDYSLITPILRPLSDMTNEEKDELGFKAFGVLRDSLGAPTLPQRFVSIKWAARNTAYLLSKHFDLFGLIESGQAIDATKFNSPTVTK